MRTALTMLKIGHGTSEWLRSYLTQRYRCRFPFLAALTGRT